MRDVAAVASVAAPRIRDLRVVAEALSWASDLDVVRKASARMNRQSTVEDVGRVVVEELRRVVDYHNCRVYLRDAGDALVPIAFAGRVGPYEDVDLDRPPDARGRRPDGMGGGDGRGSAARQRAGRRARDADPGYGPRR